MYGRVCYYKYYKMRRDMMKKIKKRNDNQQTRSPKEVLFNFCFYQREKREEIIDT